MFGVVTVRVASPVDIAGPLHTTLKGTVQNIWIER